ncbi:MAG: hypothetical protein HN551_01595 [Tateyamaria sp.]|jgi:hypothetical protein|nr:hypothetical protein [Tateyamaria sp.]
MDHALYIKVVAVVSDKGPSGCGILGSLARLCFIGVINDIFGLIEFLGCVFSEAADRAFPPVSMLYSQVGLT